MSVTGLTHAEAQTKLGQVDEAMNHVFSSCSQCKTGPRR